MPTAPLLRRPVAAADDMSSVRGPSPVAAHTAGTARYGGGQGRVEAAGVARRQAAGSGALHPGTGHPSPPRRLGYSRLLDAIVVPPTPQTRQVAHRTSRAASIEFVWPAPKPNANSGRSPMGPSSGPCRAQAATRRTGRVVGGRPPVGPVAERQAAEVGSRERAARVAAAGQPQLRVVVGTSPLLARLNRLPRVGGGAGGDRQRLPPSADWEKGLLFTAVPLSDSTPRRRCGHKPPLPMRRRPPAVCLQQ